MCGLLRSLWQCDVRSIACEALRLHGACSIFQQPARVSGWGVLEHALTAAHQHGLPLFNSAAVDRCLRPMIVSRLGDSGVREGWHMVRAPLIECHVLS